MLVSLFKNIRLGHTFLVENKTYHIIRVTRIITASFNAEKNFFSGFALAPILPKTIPKTIENTAKPRMFMPPVGFVPTPIGIVLEPGYISLDTVVMLNVALYKIVWIISSFSASDIGFLPLTLYSSYFPGSFLYCVFF